MWCREPNHKAELRYMALHRRSYIRPTQIFFSPLLSCRLKYLAKRQQLVVSFLSQADCCQEWVGAPLYVSAYDYLLTIIFFSQPVATFSWLLLIGEWGACKNCRALPYEAFSWKNERRFFVAKGAHHIEVASKYYTYSGESNKKTATFCFVSCPPRPHRALLHACSS